MELVYTYSSDFLFEIYEKLKFIEKIIRTYTNNLWVSAEGAKEYEQNTVKTPTIKLLIEMKSIHPYFSVKKTAIA